VSVSPERPWLRELLRDNGLNGKRSWWGNDPGEDELRALPAPLAWLLPAAIDGARKDAGNAPVATLLAKLHEHLGLASGDFVDVVKFYKEQPSTLLFILSNLRFLKWGRKIRRGLVGGGWFPVRRLLPDVAGEQHRPPLVRHLEKATGPELAFWAKALFENAVTQPLVEARARRRCPVWPKEAPTALRLLRELDANPAEGMLAELAPWATPLRASLERAAALRERAVAGAALNHLQEAAEALAGFRQELATHLEEVLARRGDGPWAALKTVLEVTQSSSLPGLATRLRLLYQGGTPEEVESLPPAQLLVDALWLTQAGSEGRKKREAAEQALGWCWALVCNGNMTTLENAEPLKLDEARQLREQWDRLDVSWKKLDIARLYEKLGMKGELAGREALVARRCKEAATALKDAPASGIPEEMSRRVVELALWADAGRIRGEALKQLKLVGEVVRSIEGQEKFREARGRVEEILSQPANEWVGLADQFVEATDFSTMEAESEGYWAELLELCPDELRKALSVEGLLVRKEGLGVVLGAIASHLGETESGRAARARELDARQACYRRLASALGVELSELGGPLLPGIPDRPQFGTETFDRVTGLLLQGAHDAELEQWLKQQKKLLVAALRGRVCEAFVPPAAPGIRRTATEAEPEGVSPALAVLEKLLDESKADAVLEALERVVQLGKALAVRRDMLGEERPLVSGRELLSLGAAPEWCGDGEGRALLPVLRDILDAEPDVPALLANQKNLDGWVASVFSARDAGNGRRWWGRLYRDLTDWLRDVAARIGVKNLRIAASLVQGAMAGKEAPEAVVRALHDEGQLKEVHGGIT
jgi:hypothetical protein